MRSREQLVTLKASHAVLVSVRNCGNLSVGTSALSNHSCSKSPTPTVPGAVIGAECTSVNETKSLNYGGLEEEKASNQVRKTNK